MFIRDLFFPRLCFSCGYLGVYICPSCIVYLDLIKEQRCFYCKRKSLYGLTHPGCKRKNGVDGVVSLFFYNATMKKIIKGVKYSLVLDGARELQYLVGFFGKENLLFYKKLSPLFIQPIPLSQNKQKTRGFNQSLIISSYISYLLNLPPVSILERTHDALPQAQIQTRRERRKNMNKAFQISKKEKPPRNILLVDDVITSGSTAQAAAATLKKDGVKKVYVFSVAKG